MWAALLVVAQKPSGLRAVPESEQPTCCCLRAHRWQPFHTKVGFLLGSCHGEPPRRGQAGGAEVGGALAGSGNVP